MLKEGKNKILILGIGNTGRQDDGLGWLANEFLKKKVKEIDVEYRYQLQIEDAELIAGYPSVIFADATREETEYGFYCKKGIASGVFGLTTHALLPETILYLAKDLYHKEPESLILGIQGYEWDLKNGISPRALENLDKAMDFVLKVIETQLNFYAETIRSVQ